MCRLLFYSEGGHEDPLRRSPNSWSPCLTLDLVRSGVKRAARLDSPVVHIFMSIGPWLIDLFALVTEALNGLQLFTSQLSWRHVWRNKAELSASVSKHGTMLADRSDGVSSLFGGHLRSLAGWIHALQPGVDRVDSDDLSDLAVWAREEEKASGTSVAMPPVIIREQNGRPSLVGIFHGERASWMVE